MPRVGLLRMSDTFSVLPLQAHTGKRGEESEVIPPIQAAVFQDSSAVLQVRWSEVGSV